MHTLYITEKNASLDITSDNFQVFNQQKISQQVLIKPVEHIIFFSPCQLSPKARMTIRNQQITVCFIHRQGEFVAHYHNKLKNTVYYIQQKNRQKAFNFGQVFSENLVRAKLQNRQKLLKQFLVSQNHQKIQKAIHNLASFLNLLPNQYSIKALAHLENQSTEKYIPAFYSLLPSSFSTSKDSKSQIMTAVQTLLKLGSALLSHQIYHYITQLGLHPNFGHLNTNCPNHTALVCDLLEQFYPQLVEESLLLADTMGIRRKVDVGCGVICCC